MLLLVDAGNTRVKWALAPRACVNAGDWLANGDVLHEAIDSLGKAWQNLGIDAVLISNVAGMRMQALLEEQLACLAGGLGPVSVTWFASQAMVAGVRNHYREPHRLGCDRLASMIGARALQPGRPLLIATCGTATTIDALTAAGDFIGGMIVPGLGVMAASLAQHTAQLPAVSTLTGLAQQGGARQGGESFADNTEEAMVRGCLSAQAGAIERGVSAHANAHCILAGGAAKWVLPYLRVGVTLVENLVLIGLHAVAIGLTDSNDDFSGPRAPC